MKAVVIHEYGDPSVLKYGDFPDPVPGEGEVLVRMAATSINPYDCKQRSGALKERFPLHFPAVLGSDVAGTVQALGPDVTGFAVGDRVMGMGSQTYAELTVAKAANLTRVPAGLAMTTAGSLPLVTQTGAQLITHGTKIKKGQTMLVTGAVGAVGRSAVCTAKNAGAYVIAGVKTQQMEEANSLGADEVLALDDHDAMQALRPLDAVADTVGHDVGEMLMGKVKQGGVFASVLTAPKNISQYPAVTFVYVKTVPSGQELAALAQNVLAGRLTIPIERIVALKDAAEGQAAVEKGGIGKVVLKV